MCIRDSPYVLICNKALKLPIIIAKQISRQSFTESITSRVIFLSEIKSLSSEIYSKYAYYHHQYNIVVEETAAHETVFTTTNLKRRLLKEKKVVLSD